MPHEIIPPQLAIKAMRDSGYRDAAHALAELIDNSIQAGQGINAVTNVEVLCVDTSEIVQERQRNRINRIAVYDNASGMDMATLRLALQFGNGTHLKIEEQKGIGKFGMGLPNSSISQCRRVDVWSWQDGKCFTTHLDIDEILKGETREVPEPKRAEIPKEWRRLIAHEIGPKGTLVVWTKLDRIKWKSSKSLLENTEFLVGRIYRYFINEGTAKIRLAAFSDGGGMPDETLSYQVRPNDPLYLMKNTSAPEPFNHQPAFDSIHEDALKVKYGGKDHVITIRYSVTKAEARQKFGGSSPIGQHAAKNQGVSLVRAHREIEMNRTFENRYDPTERWWGVEILFEPSLDEVFGVTNNKQSANAFYQMDLDEDAKVECMLPERYRDYLEETGDSRLIIYEVSQRIGRMLSTTLRPQVKRYGEGKKKPGDSVAPAGSAEDIATRATQRRRATIGDKGRSDKDEKLPEDQRQKELAYELMSGGLPETIAKQTAVSVTRAGIKFIFQETPVPGSVIFDVKSKAGTIIIIVNSNHPASVHLFELLENKNGDSDTPALKALKLLLSAWARLEDEAGDQRRQQLEDTRSDWGRLARDFFQVADE